MSLRRQTQPIEIPVLEKFVLQGIEDLRDEHVAALLAAKCGRDVILGFYRPKKPFAFIIVESKDSYNVCENVDGSYFGGRELRLLPAKKPISQIERSRCQDRLISLLQSSHLLEIDVVSLSKLYVGGVNGIQKATLINHFDTLCGEKVVVALITLSPGIGLMNDPNHAFLILNATDERKILKFSKSFLQGRILKVAQPNFIHQITPEERKRYQDQAKQLLAARARAKEKENVDPDEHGEPFMFPLSSFTCRCLPSSCLHLRAFNFHPAEKKASKSHSDPLHPLVEVKTNDFCTPEAKTKKRRV